MEKEGAQIKIGLVGDTKSGKTCIISSYTTDEYSKDHKQTIFETCKCSVKIENTKYQLSLWDTTGDPKRYSSLEALFQGNFDMFFVCFSVSKDEKEQVDSALQWYERVKKKGPVMFIGTKCDLRELSKPSNQEQNALTSIKEYSKRELEEKFAGLNCQYCECSALTQEGLKETFDTALKTIIKNRDLEEKKRSGKKNRKCMIF